MNVEPVPANTSTQALEQARNLLSFARGRSTQARLHVLAILLQAESALSHVDIENLAAQQGIEADRVTLYRALDWLVERGLAHRIAGADRAWRYNAQVGLAQQHAHFYCRACQQVFCLENLQPALLFALPQGYQLEQVELNLQGHCPACQARH